MGWSCFGGFTASHPPGIVPPRLSRLPYEIGDHNAEKHDEAPEKDAADS
jgi:hypothetical protein